MARVELEVDRNVLELITMLPDPPPVDRCFYADVWQPQEIRHGQILDELQVRLGRDARRRPTSTHVSAKIRILGALSHVDPIQDVVRMLYYLTGMATERSAVLAYNLLHDGRRASSARRPSPRRSWPRSGARSPATTRSTRCRRAGWPSSCAGWQKFLVRHMRRISFAPVGANNAEQKADFGDLLARPGHRPTTSSRSRSRSPASSASCCGRGTAGCGSPTTCWRRSARPSSWPGPAPR